MHVFVEKPQIFILSLGSATDDFFSLSRAQWDEFAIFEDSISVDNVKMFDQLCVARMDGPRR